MLAEINQELAEKAARANAAAAAAVAAGPPTIMHTTDGRTIVQYNGRQAFIQQGNWVPFSNPVYFPDWRPKHLTKASVQLFVSVNCCQLDLSAQY